MNIEFVNPTKELINLIAFDMRQADADEVWASNHHSPNEALLRGWELSDRSVIILINDEPCVMIGLVIRDLLAGTGVPWMLGTELALKYKRNFITQVPHVISEMLNTCPKLSNYVHVKNTISVKWLKRIGFTLDDPVPHGVEGDLFYRFHMEKV